MEPPIQTRIFALRWSNNFDLHCGGSKGRDLLLHAGSNARVHGGDSRRHGVGVQVLTDFDVALHDGVVGGLVDTAGLHTQE